MSLLQPCLLLLLSECPKHGYALIEHLRSFELMLQDDPGTVYRTLRALERRGLVEARWEPNPAGPARKVYSITTPGTKILKTWTRDLETARKLLDSYLSRYRNLSDQKPPEAEPPALKVTPGNAVAPP
ncbi:helix-turn-helix transcriptional regulator [Actinomadura adrarensis]|uniref:Helix-turn-helix transcriptional regulator n=1 Tax=Actinomadura adrarensis TaxID=1819600 RepID=A0ABW3CL74_9ACTN